MSTHTHKPRPVYLSLTEFRFPLPAIASIIHRITGVLLFLGIGYLLWLLDLALESAEGFAAAGALLDRPFPKLVLWGVLVLVAYHLVAGIKHLLLDFHLGDTIEAAVLGAYVTFAATALIAVALGAWLW